MTARRLKKDKRWIFLKFCFFAYLFVGAFALIWLRTQVVNLEYEIGQMGDKKAELAGEGKSASAEKASTYSVANIEKVAINQLGMKFPSRERIFYVRKAESAGPYRASVESKAAVNDRKKVFAKEARRMSEREP